MSEANDAQWQTSSPEETMALGETIGRHLAGGLVIGLIGHLGAGKTLLVKGIALGNGLQDVRRVTSPTFTLLHQYPGQVALYHADVYRLASSAELAGLGFDELVAGTLAFVVEWADRVRDDMPDDTLWITLESTGLTTRTITAEAFGPVSKQCLEAIRSA